MDVGNAIIFMEVHTSALLKPIDCLCTVLATVEKGCQCSLPKETSVQLSLEAVIFGNELRNVTMVTM